MNKLFLITLVTIATLLLSSCSNNQRVDVVSVNSVRISEINNTGVIVDVETALFNGFKQKITIEKATLDIKNNDSKVAIVTLDKEVILAKNSTSLHNLPLKIRISQGAFTNIRELLLKPVNINIEGTITGRMGVLRKKVKIKHTLSEENKRLIIKHIKQEIGLP